MRPLPCLVCCGALLAQEPPRGTFDERPAVMLSNNRLELTILTTGGSFASLVLRDDPEKLSPFWRPGGKGASMGHFVCVDGFGPVSPEERAAGLPGHGEAHVVPWDVVRYAREGTATTLRFAAKLPLVEEVFTRTLRVVDGENVVYVDSELESLLGFDRPVCWAEHATIGSPFLEPLKTVVDMPARRAKTRVHPAKPGALPRRLASFADFTWPLAPAIDGGTVDLRAAPANPGSIDHTTCLLDPSRPLVWVTALHTEKRLLLGYMFRREEYPWLQNWENYPPSLKMARGMEFSTQPFDVPRRDAIGLQTLFDAPTYRWLPAKSKIATRFLFFYARAPEGMRRVEEVRIDGGTIIVEGNGKRLALPASLGM